MHFIGDIVDVFEFKLGAYQLIEFQIVRHCGVNEPWNVDMRRDHAVQVSDNRFLLKGQHLKGQVSRLVMGC